jgi:tetratricopeptide (TPR) repeat protein
MKFATRSVLRPLLCAVLGFSLATGCSGGHARFLSHLQRGQEYLSTDNLDKASVEFRNALQIEPKNADALYYSGQVAEAKGDIRLAVGLYLGALEANPLLDSARARLGRMYIFGGAAQRAQETIGPGLERHPDDADLLAVRAAVREQQKDDVGALADAKRAHEVAPKNENAVAVLAAIYSRRGENDQALVVTSETLQQVPSSVDLRSVLTNLYLLTDQPAKAQEQMRRIIELRPRDLAVRNRLASFLLRRHEVDAAQDVLEQAANEAAKWGDEARANTAKLALVEFISAQRSRAEGEKKLRSLIQQQPDNLDLRLGLGTLLQRTGAAADAVGVYKEVIAADGVRAKGLMARDRLANIYLSQGNEAEASRVLKETLKNSPRDNDALILRSTIEMRNGDAASAIADLRAVLRDQPASVPLQRSLAAAYVQKGEPALAEETLRAALRAAPNEVPLRLDLAALLARTERGKDELSVLEEAVQQVPGSADARVQLILAYVKRGNPAGARAQALELQQRQPRSALGFYYAGLVAEQQKLWDESRGQLEQALKVEPRYFAALVALVNLDVRRGAYDSALKRLQAAAADEPGNAAVVMLLGDFYLERKDVPQAKQQFTKAMALNPKAWQPHRDMAVAALAEKDVPAALSQYQEALKIAPGEAALAADAARVYEKYDKVAEAIAVYEALYRSNPGARQLAANNLAMLLVTYHNDQPSLDRARDLTSEFAGSNNGSLLDTAGWVRFKRGEFKDALPTLQRAVDRAPGSSVIRFHLAMAELQMGMRDQARSNLETALTGSAEFQGMNEARVALASLKDRV